MQKAECDADTAADMKSSSTQIDCTVEGRRCLNGGVCVRRDDDQTMFCKCVPPHTGTHCDKMTPSDAQIDETEQPTTTTIVNNPIGALIPSSQMVRLQIKSGGIMMCSAKCEQLRRVCSCPQMSSTRRPTSMSLRARVRRFSLCRTSRCEC